MRLLLLILFFFNISLPIFSNTIFYLTKIPNLTEHNFNADNGIKYLKAKKFFNIGIVNNNVECDVANEKDIKDKFSKIKENFDKYEKSFLKKVNLRYVVLCNNLKVSNIKTAGVPNHNVKTLIIDINSDKRYFERSLHHELFHMIDDSFDNLFSYENWKKFNNKSFQYAKCSTCTNKLNLDLIKETNGFLTEYSMSTASEDMAEIFSFLMTDSKNLSKIMSNDQILNIKVDYIKDKILKIDNNFKFKDD